METFASRLFTFENALMLLLIFVPISIILEFLHADPLWVFLSSSIAIIPLAGFMGKSTEHLAEKFGAGLGGLLNATFGNAAELIIALMALRKGLYEVVKASITGSIIGNILLVLGLSILLGGLQFSTQSFNRTAAGMGATMLTLSVIGLVVPAIFHSIVQGLPNPHEIEVSLEISFILFATYILSLIFSLKTHKHLYAGDPHMDEEAIGTAAWSKTKAVTVLLVSTALVALMSEFLVGAIESAAKSLGLSDIFVGVILVAIIGNAAEHSTAILVAMKNKMDLALNIAVGSSLQVALFVAPVLVFASFLFGSPMDLVFTTFEIISIGLAVGIVSLISFDGESNWMEGVQLLAVYIILGIAFYFLP